MTYGIPNGERSGTNPPEQRHKTPLEDALDRFGQISLSPTETLEEFLKRYDAAQKRDAGIPTNGSERKNP